MYEPYPICTQHKIFKLLKVHCNLTLLDTKLRKVEDECIIVVLQGNRESLNFMSFSYILYYPGTFSNVYLAKMNRIPDELCALKHIIPTSGPGRIENELKCLQDIG